MGRPSKKRMQPKSGTPFRDLGSVGSQAQAGRLPHLGLL